MHVAGSHLSRQVWWSVLHISRGHCHAGWIMQTLHNRYRNRGHRHISVMSWHCRLNWLIFHGSVWTPVWQFWVTGCCTGGCDGPVSWVLCDPVSPVVCVAMETTRTVSAWSVPAVPLASAVPGIWFTDEPLSVVSALSVAVTLWADSVWSWPERSVPREAVRSVHGRPVLRRIGSGWTGIHSDLNSQRRWIPRTGLRTRDLSENVWFPEEMAP